MSAASARPRGGLGNAGWKSGLSLAALTLHTSTSAILTQRVGRNVDAGVSVFLSELLKTIASLIWLALEHRNGKGKGGKKRRLPTLLLDDSLPFLLPSILYVVQNFMQVRSANCIPATIYQAACQCKIVASASISTFVYGRRPPSPLQWIAIGALSVGVVCLLLDMDDDGIESAAQLLFRAQEAQAVLTICLASFAGSLAGMMLEIRLQDQAESTLARQNLGLSIVGTLTSGAILLARNDGSHNLSSFLGLSRGTWYAVVSRAIGGLTVSAVLRFAGSLAKGFATVLAIVLTVLYDVLYTDAALKTEQVLACGMIVTSTFLYYHFRR